jgi:hypothetical protein
MSAPGYAGSQYILNINGSGGAFVPIIAKSTVRRLIVRESTITSAGVANTLQGLLQYKVPNDNTANGFTTIFSEAGANTIAAQGNVVEAEITLGGDRTQHMEMGEIIGQLAQPIVGLPAAQQAAAAATTMMQIRSGTATGTSVTVIEYN